MTLPQRIALGAAAAWFSRVVSILLNLVLLPVLFRHLPKEELGVWLLLGQTGAAFGILDLGFGVTLTRRIAFVKGRSGADPAMRLPDAALTEIGNLAATASRIYWVLALAACAVSWGAGFLYFQRLQLDSVSFGSIWMSWSLLCIGQAFVLRANVWSCVLLGVGYVGWDTFVAAIVTVLGLLLQIAVVLLGGGLIALSAVAAGAAIAQRALIPAIARRMRPELFALRGRWSGEIFRSLTPSALRAWLTALGASMVLYTDQILIAAQQGAAGIPAYRAAFVLIHNLTVVAVAMALASGVFITHLWQTGDLQQVHRIVTRNARFGWLLMLSSAAYLLTAGESLFTAWLGAGNFAGYAVLLVFLTTETFETQSFIIATASRATEDEAFALSSIAAGVLKLALSWVFAQRLGLVGIALGTTVALLATNHWYMVYRGLRRLKLSWRNYARSVCLPCVMAFPALLAILQSVRHLVRESSALVQLIALTAVAGVLFALSVWGLVLGPAHRARVGRMFRIATKLPA